jgi:hypothetical protein
MYPEGSATLEETEITTASFPLTARLQFSASEAAPVAARGPFRGGVVKRGLQAARAAVKLPESLSNIILMLHSGAHWRF